MIALYARVSTDDKGQDPEMQLRELREYAARKGLTVGAEFVDYTSGAKTSRPQLDRLLAEAKAGKFTAVMVWKFDRMARSVVHLLSVLDSLVASGVQFHSLTEGVDTSTPAGKFTMTVLGAAAELERSMMIERTKAGMRNAKAKGVHCGRPRKVISIKTKAA
jgi:DNA invertase Pin-like site-specific DNA recombinase